MKHAPLTVREIHGPYMQLLTNLQGDNGQEWLDALKKFNRRENPWEVKTPTCVNKHTMVVPLYGSIPERVDLGKYDWVHNEIFKQRFLQNVDDDGKWGCVLSSVDNYLSDDKLECPLVGDSWIDAKILHLLAYGVTFPKDQLKQKIIALGTRTVVNDIDYVAVLSNGLQGRGLDFVKLCDCNSLQYAFLRVRRFE